MSMLSAAFDYQRLQEDEVAWKLLRAKNAPVIIAILDAHLGSNNRKLAVAEFESLVAVDLEEFQLRTDFSLTRSAKAYCDTWREDGYLVRRSTAQARQETYELSSGALAAIAFAKQLVQPRRTATQSRLTTIINQINSLARALDYNEESRRASLLEERARIDEQLMQLDAGTHKMIDQGQALERVQDIITLAQEIPRDFAMVRDDFERINKSLYSKIINFEEDHRDVMEDIFSGVDQISQSPSGKSFKGFYSLLRDTELTEVVQDDIDAILENDFAHYLSLDDRRFLKNILKEFLDQSQEVDDVMSSFSQSLRRFVQNQDFQQDRVLKQLIDKSLGKANEVLDRYPSTKKLDFQLELTSIKMRSVSRYTMKNPAESRAVPIEVFAAPKMDVLSLAELRAIARETEIDFSELVSNVNNFLSHQGNNVSPGVSVSEVLQAYPASQGVASVVGLMVLAAEQGRITEQRETVRWNTAQGNTRHAQIKRLEFFREIEL